MMAWFVQFFRMLFSKRERIVGDESSYKSRQGFVVDLEQDDVAVKEPPVIQVPFPLEDLPAEVVARIGSELDFTDLVSFRQASQSLNHVYKTHRTMMKGAEIHVFVTIEDGLVVTLFRGHKQVVGPTRPVAVSDRNLIFCNSSAMVTLRLGDAQMTEEAAKEIRGMFMRSTLRRVQLEADTVSEEMRDLVNDLNCEEVFLDIGRYNEVVLEVRNMKLLKIREQLNFFDLTPIYNLMLPTLCLRVSAAALPGIRQCIDEWKTSRREILSWFFKIPIVERYEVFNPDDARIDWRRSMIRRTVGHGRLLNLSRFTAPEEGDEFIYQTISYLQQP